MRQKKTKISLMIHFLILLTAGLMYIRYTWINTIKVTEKHALEIARTAEAGFQTDVVKRLISDPGDVPTEEYLQIKTSLVDITKINKQIRFAYLYIVKEDKVYFLADSEPASSPDYSPHGQEYEEADKDTYRAYYENRPMITKASTDRWGTWVSVLVPMKNYFSGKNVAVLGIDYPVKVWKQEANRHTVQAIIEVLCIFLLYFTLHAIIRSNQALKDEKNKLSLSNKIISQKEELFRTLYEQSPIGVTFGSFDNKFIEANPMFGKIVGRSVDEISKLNWMEITHPDDIQKDMELLAQLKRGEIDGYSLKKRYLRPDGSVAWTNIKISPLKFNNNVLNHICIVEDITEQLQTEISLQESERSNAMLLSNLPGMAYRSSFNRDWTMQFVSEGCYELTGYRPESLIENRISFHDIICPEYREKLWETWNKVLNNKAVLKEEYYITTASKEVKWVLEHGQGVYNDQGEVVAIEGIIIDMSDRKKKEDEILYLTYHDVLSGIYNRQYFEDAKRRLDRKENYPLSVIVGDINGVKLINSAIGHQEGDNLIRQMARILESCLRQGDILARTGGDEFSILLPNTTNVEADKIVNQIGRVCEDYKNNTSNEAYHISISLGCATKTEELRPLSGIIKEAEEGMYRHKLLQNKSLHSSIISSMKTTLYEKSQETEEHAQRLIDLSKAIGHKLGLAEGQLNELQLLSTLHDIGKIGIKDYILNKPGRLSDEEWVEMKKHPEMGYRIAMSTPELAPIAEYILCHHERWDGKGYPYGKAGEEIPLLSRIIAIADSYDAMTSDRVYSKAMPREKAMDEIRRNAGTQFDPVLCDIFISILNEEIA